MAFSLSRRSCWFPAGCLAVAGCFSPSADAAIVVDLSQVLGIESPGEQLNTSYNLATQTATATIEDMGSVVANINFSLTADPRFTTGDPPVKDRPIIRVSADGLGIDSGLPNGADTTTNLDETDASLGHIPETMTFSFDTALSIDRIGLALFDSHVTNNVTYQDTVSITVGGVTTTYAANAASVTPGQTVAGDAGISIITLPSPITLAAGQTITFGVVNDGDGSLAGADRSSFRLQSFEVTIPEPGSIALAGLGLGLMLVRRR